MPTNEQLAKAILAVARKIDRDQTILDNDRNQEVHTMETIINSILND